MRAHMVKQPDPVIVNAVEEIQSLANQVEQAVEKIVNAVAGQDGDYGFELDNISDSAREIRENVNDFKHEYQADLAEAKA
jgi:hypothetical protein